MQPSKAERIHYCAKFGIRVNVAERKWENKCDNCGNSFLMTYLESNSIKLCFSCAEIINPPQKDLFDPFDYLSDMCVKKDSHFSSKHDEPKFNYRLKCDIG
uniref:Uncharacterized protein n=1 Tax=viral metagenome TaxID=1070528 RepID=A0A6C0C8F6_9ZZZZ